MLAFVHVCVCVCVAHMWRQAVNRPENNLEVISQELSTFSKVLLPWSSPSRSGSMASKPQGSSCSIFSVLG